MLTSEGKALPHHHQQGRHGDGQKCQVPWQTHLRGGEMVKAHGHCGEGTTATEITHMESCSNHKSV